MPAEWARGPGPRFEDMDLMQRCVVLMIKACEDHLEPPYNDEIGQAFVELRRQLDYQLLD